MSFRISQKTAVNIFTELLKKNGTNKQMAIEAIVTHINDSALEYIMDLLSAPEKMELVYPNEYVRVPIKQYHVNNKFDYDVLKEMGLLCEETNSVYGRINGDSSWSSEYNPYYGSLKVALFYHDKDNQISEYEETINTSEVVKVKKNEIPYFKSLEQNGKNIASPIEIRDQILGDHQEDVLTAN